MIKNLLTVSAIWILCVLVTYAENERNTSNTGSKESVTKLIKQLSDPQWNVRATAALNLGALNAKEAIPDLMKLLKDTNEKMPVRLNSAMALMKLNAKEAIPEIMKLLKERDEDTVEVAVLCLGKLGAKEAIPDLMQLLKDPKRADARLAAAYALGDIGAKEAIPELVKLLNDKHDDVCFAAGWALAKLDAKSVIPDVKKLMKNSDEGICFSISSALAKLGVKDAIPDLVRILNESKQSERRGLSAIVLVEIGEKDKVTKEVIKDIVLCAHDDVSGRAKSALKELGVGNEEIRTILTQSAKEKGKEGKEGNEKEGNEEGGENEEEGD